MNRPTWQCFESVLADPITRYLAVKRSMGCRFATEDRALRLLDRYVADRGIARISDITGTLLDAFIASRPRPNATSYNNLIGIVRRLFEWMVEQHELAVSPLTAPTRPQTARRLPFLYEPETIRQLLAHAAELSDYPRCPQRGSTYATIFALLAVLGLRVGEASRLQCGDIDLTRELLLVRNGKFGKSRLIPFGPRLAARLRAYAALREQRRGLASPAAPFFTWNGRTAVHTNSIRNAFREIVPRLALTVPPGTQAPCVHGLRHTFAVRTLLRWYREGIDPNARLNHLATFLGHVNPNSTAVYLTITGELLRAANDRFEAFAAPKIQQVQP